MMLTETVVPKELKGRHRIKMSTRDVIDAFLHERQTVARSANLYLDRGQLFSYGRHWPLARWVRRGYVKFMLIRTEKGSAMTATKHRSPLISAATECCCVKFFVPNVMTDNAEGHLENYAWMLGQAEDHAERTLRGPIALRQPKAWQAVDSLMMAFYYANTVGLTGKPDGETPHGVLRDWLEENEPELVHLRRCAAALCPLTGTPLS